MICLDTAVLIWGVQGKADAAGPDMVARTERYLQQLEKEKRQLLIPTPVVVEYLAGITTERRARQHELLQRRFYIPAFDAPSAVLAAELWSEVSNRHDDAQQRPDRQCVKTDCLIIATAIHHRAECIVTSEVKFFRRVCGDRISVIEVPVTVENLSLPFG